MKLEDLNLTEKQAAEIESIYCGMSIHGVVIFLLNNQTNKIANFALSSYTPGEDILVNFKGTVRTTPDFGGFDRAFVCKEKIFSAPEWSEEEYDYTIKRIKDVVEYTKNR
jgi:hypothetical protein